jgi:hypothetical protein
MMRLTHVPKRRAGLAALLLITAGCGGGGSSSPDPIASPGGGDDTGQLAVTITDAEGDFVAYLVDVTSVRLTRTNGDVVETLPLTTRIDFTELAEVTEFLTVATVPVGVYESAVLSLDFSTAEVLVQDALGNAVAAELVDASGAPLDGAVEVALELDAPIRITPATTRSFSLDFDLDATNTVDLGAAPPMVTVEPVLLAVTELEENREHRVRGLLRAVDESTAEVTLAVRPLRLRSGEFGRLTFAVDAETGYEIDGVAYPGDQGLAVLADLPADTPVVAAGTAADGRLLADRVLAGDSVYWADAEIARGVVTARDADGLTLQGVTVSFPDGRVGFRREIAVSLGPDTVVAAADAADLDPRSISVGQRVMVSGTLSGDAELDATEGRVRMLVTRLWGDVVTADPLVVDLHLLAGRRPRIFDFAGTGTTAAEDADPAAYQVDTATLGLLDLDAGDLVQVRGLVNRFGFAPPDFLARTVVDVAADSRGATAAVVWPDGASMPFSTVAPDRLDLALADAHAVLTLRGRLRDVPVAIERLALVAPLDGDGVYGVVERGTGRVTLYRQFNDLADALTQALDAGATLHRLVAHGRYTELGSELVTERASFVLRTDTDGTAP